MPVMAIVQNVVTANKVQNNNNNHTGKKKANASSIHKLQKLRTCIYIQLCVPSHSVFTGTQTILSIVQDKQNNIP